MLRNLQLLLAAVAATAVLAGGAAVADPASVIEERREFMKELGNQLGVVRAFVQEGTGEATDVAEAGRNIAERAERIPALFPEGTGMHEVEIKTGARPAIWENPDDFAAKAEALHGAALQLVELAEQGADRPTIGAEMAALGREGCGGCHETYRERLD